MAQNRSIMTNINMQIPTGDGVAATRHPEYIKMSALWSRYRDTYVGGQSFIDTYLTRLSKRETVIEFNERRDQAYCPAHAKTAVNEVKDAICERLVDVTRIGGPLSYRNAVEGTDGGVDQFGSTLNGFVSREILPELLPLGKVGVYVDRPRLPERYTRADKVMPYLYTYKTEDILSWVYNKDGKLEKVLLRDTNYKLNDLGLPDGTITSYRYLELTEAGVMIDFYDQSGTLKPLESVTLNLKTLPFVIFEIQQSLMTDIANYQIALLNLGSSDLNYAIKANFPFYVEQFDPRQFNTMLLQSGPAEDSDGVTTTPGSNEEAHTPKDNEIHVGTAQGRRYPKGLEAPSFIHPSPEPLDASMKKQAELKEEIRSLIRLSLKSLASSSSDSKKQDERSVESGLAAIGYELAKGERNIATVWADYEKDTSASIKYPSDYSLRTDAERRDEAKEIEEHITKTPSDTLKKTLTKQVAKILVGHKISYEELETIYNEIADAEVIITDPQVIRDDLEAGLLSTQLASTLRGYPIGEVEQAKIDHAERIKRIAVAQSSAAINGARGVNDLDTENNTGSEEKTLSRQTDLDSVVTNKTRGQADG